MDTCTATIDPVIYNDQRVLENLLKIELDYVPKCNYFQGMQPDLKPFMRKIVATWMLELCEEERCEAQVLPTALNYLDRFLCECRVDKSQLQMIASVCLLLASKVRECHALPIDRLVYYTDNSVTDEQLRQFEEVVVTRLNWDVSSVTAFEFVDHLLERLPWTCDRSAVRRHARFFVNLCYTEAVLFRKSPSLIASGCLLAAGRGLRVAGTTAASVCDLSRCLPHEVEDAVIAVEDMINAARPAPAPAKHTAISDHDYSYPGTPTDVTDIYF